MPFKSKSQARWAHSADGTAALGGRDKVKEWDAATKKGPGLPERVAPKQQPRKAKRGG